MPPPSQLSIAISSVLRLVKEEASYHKELQQQEARIQKLRSETGDENAEFTIKQEVQSSGFILQPNPGGAAISINYRSADYRCEYRRRQ